MTRSFKGANDESWLRSLSHSISRRRFVGGLTKAGLTATAAGASRFAVTSYAQGAGPQPNPAPAAPGGAGSRALPPRRWSPASSRSRTGGAAFEPAIVMQAAVVGMANAIGQMFNAFKEQTPLVVYT